MHPITRYYIFWGISGTLVHKHYVFPCFIKVGKCFKNFPNLDINKLRINYGFFFISALDTLLQEHDIELSLITLNWFLTLYSSVLHIRIIMRLWDLFLFDGSRILFQVAIAMLKLHEDELLKADNSAEIFNILSTIPSR